MFKHFDPLHNADHALFLLVVSVFTGLGMVAGFILGLMAS